MGWRWGRKKEKIIHQAIDKAGAGVNLRHQFFDKDTQINEFRWCFDDLAKITVTICRNMFTIWRK